MVEIVCQSVADAVHAQEGGAGRIELCSALPLGGLTPTPGLLTAVKAATSLSCMAMVRPRPGGFVYSFNELSVMEADARLLIDCGADGIVFGCLTEERTIHVAACRRLIAIAQGRETVFHRAFDCLTDPVASLNVLIDLGIKRVLTSGGKPTALEGAGNIADWIARVEERIEILPGGGIRAHNIRELLVATRAKQVHLAPLTLIPETIPFDCGTASLIDTEAVRAVVTALREG